MFAKGGNMKRFSVSLKDETAQQLENLAAFTNESLSSVLAKKIEEALDRDEDAYWLKIVEEREKDGEESYLSHEEVWAHLK